jgi:putative endopeptidase
VTTWRYSFLLVAMAAAGGAGLVSAEDPSPKAPRLWRSLDRAGMDPSADPAADFYQYANGKWLAATEIPADRASVYIFTLLQDENRKTLQKLLETAASETKEPPGSLRSRLGTFYRSGMDETAIEAAGSKPLAAEFQLIDSVKDPTSLCAVLARLHLLRVNAGFNVASNPDDKDSKRVILVFSQGGLGLPDRDYYLKEDEKSRGLRAAYLDHVTRMFELLGDKLPLARENATTVLTFESRLAKASRTLVQLRDPHLNYHLMTRADVQAESPALSWKQYLDAIGLGKIEEINVGQPDFLKEIGQVVKDVPPATWKTYLRWRLIDAYAPYLSKDFVDADFHFKGTLLSGALRNRPRSERVVATIDELMGEALGQLYVERAFPPAVKKRAEALVQNLKATLRERLAQLDWMSPATRERAIKKLDAIAVKVGYPDHWRDYSGLVLGPSYATNVLAANELEARRDFAKVGKPMDRSEWDMSPPTVNAYYNPNRNEIVFPAGILQPPFFDADADDALNYGGIGMVIGHELTHGFDDQGRKYDAEGNLRDWWQPDDERAYKARAAEVAKQYSGYSPAQGLTINGDLTLGENIADLGGLKIAYLALKKAQAGKPATKIDGFTPDQRFFLAYAQLWRGMMRPEALRLQVLTNPHSPPRYRVLGPLYNMPEFFEAFDVPMDKRRGRLNPQPVVIW